MWVHAIGQAIRAKSGQIFAVEGAFQDITDLIAEQEKAGALSRPC